MQIFTYSFLMSQFIMNELVFFCFILENKENMFNITIEMLPSMNSLNNEIIESVLEF